ncbi:unnamed protein product [Clonostachys solani]|uniref:N-acetyltransferase domain-containing protein n=1 Tax=Clonostachys solani TaxID=160281 RepID=A0A9N9ZIF2_9HYPO|nr:unnamed protein product [Clonostachys solani]
MDSSQQVTYRTHRPGDLGYIVYQESLVFCQGLGYNQKFEALLARIAADFLENFNPTKERCWIAEKGGLFMGCVMLIQHQELEKAAKLRFLLVSDNARGQGVGSEFVRQCLGFAKEAGYESVYLGTERSLVAARNIYRRAGFEIVEAETNSEWGFQTDLETWRLQL